MEWLMIEIGVKHGYPPKGMANAMQYAPGWCRPRRASEKDEEKREKREDGLGLDLFPLKIVGLNYRIGWIG